MCLKSSARQWFAHCFEPNELQKSTTHPTVLCSIRLLQSEYKIKSLRRQGFIHEDVCLAAAGGKECEVRMNKIVDILKEIHIFHLATVDEKGNPHVRPFSSVTEYRGEALICTNNTKDVYQQMITHPQIEMSGMGKGGWIRIDATVERLDDDDARAAMLKDPTGPSRLYHVGDGIFEVFRLKDVKAFRYVHGQEVEIIEG